ncbi:MAG: ferredoxin family protein [candidate division WOR-3 bacterium]
MTKSETSHNIKLNKNWCKGCGLCVEICPKNVYDREAKVSARGFREIVIKSPDRCNRCFLCELLCPDLAITIKSEKHKLSVPKKEMELNNNSI